MPELVPVAPKNAPALPHLRDTAGMVPVDEFGVPYLICPYDAPARHTQRWDDDHSYFFSDLPELNDQAGRALRVSRVQHIPRWLHDRKHNLFFTNGVEQLPTSQSDKFALIVLAVAGYASRSALDLRGTEPKLITMSENTYRFVRGRRQLHFEMRKSHTLGCRTPEQSANKIGMFFAEYIRQHGFEDIVNESVVDEFLHTSNSAKRRKLGNKIIGHAAEAAVEPIKPLYREAFSAGFVRPAFAHPLKAVLTVFPQERWPDYHDIVENAFAA